MPEVPDGPRAQARGRRQFRAGRRAMSEYGEDGRDSRRRPRFEQQRGNPLHMIHKWSIEHPYLVVSFYFAVVVLAIMVIGFYMPRRFAPYVPSPMVGVVTMMPGLSAQEME